MVFLNILVFASIAQGLFLSISLLTSRFFKSTANTYFALFVILLIIDTTLGWINTGSVWLDFFWSIMWENLIPVMLFYYIIHSLNHKYTQAGWLKWLYAPFLITFIIDMFFALDYSFHIYTLPIKETGFAYEIITDIEDDSALLYNIFVVVWLYKIILKDKVNPDYKIKWLKQLCIFIFGLLGLWFVSDIIEDIFNADVFIFVWLSISIFFWWVCYLGIHHLRLLEQKKEIHEEFSGKQADDRLKHFSGITENEHIQRLDAMMLQEELYKNPDLSRQLVAKKLGISDGYLSQLVNSVLGKNFTDYVNSYRVEAAKEMLLNIEFNKYSLSAIGMEAGFKSKSAFYDTFKKCTGFSPGTFQKNIKKS